MCYRTSIPKAERIKLEQSMHYFDIRDYEPFYHVQGHTYPAIPVATTKEPGVIQPFRWGLVPHWFKHKQEDPTLRKNELKDISKNYLNLTCEKFNATYKSMQKKRCLIFVDGFYEHRWEDAKGKKKTPFFVFHDDHRPFTMGGLYQSWVDKDSGEVIESVGIITTPANKMMAYVHNNKKRMPLIIGDSDRTDWLDDTADIKHIESLLRPAPDGYLDAYIISNDFASPKVDANVPGTQMKIADMPDINISDSEQGALF